MSFDNKEQKQSTKLLLILAVLILVFALSVFLLMPDNIITEFNNGVGLKTAAIYSFFVTLVLITILALAGGDGLIGEVQFLLIGFLVFFVIIWLFIAWIF